MSKTNKNNQKENDFRKEKKEQTERKKLKMKPFSKKDRI